MGMSWKITEYDNKKVCHIYPTDENHIEGYVVGLQDGSVLSFCQCGTRVEIGKNGGQIVVHSSFDGREYVERVNEIINGPSV